MNGGWLAPFGSLFGAGAAVRAQLYRQGLLRTARLRGPVISVGNLSVGGSGKTPVVALIAETLRDAGFPVSILSRGYGGSFAGETLVVSDGTSVLAGAGVAGDEPVMLARSLPGVVVAVGPRRDRVGREVESRFGARVHVLDDGFQHLRLARDLDVLCVTADDLDDRPLPAGRLREFPSALSRAHVVLWNGGEPPSQTSHRPECDTYVVKRRVDGFFDLEGRPQAAPRRPYLVAGIARPERFASDVDSLVGEVAGREFHRDHHRFDARELEAIAETARSLGADALVTTAKDAVRMPPVATAVPVIVLRISAVVADEGAFKERLLSVARRVA
jgi:tetraacyldisaccharide 4'-kinase